MSQSRSKEVEQGFHPFKAMRKHRDTVLNCVAEVTLRVTSSRPYFVISAALARPVLVATGLSRKVTTAAATQILGRLNMPSREDVLTLSQRLTRMEMVLDDISAAVDASATATASAKSRPAKAEREADRQSNGAARAR